MWSDPVPQLPVRDVSQAQAWYRDVLGFEVGFLWGEDYGSVCMGGVRIHLCRASEVNPCVVCVTVDDPDAVHARYRAAGAEIISPLEDKPWGMREFTLRDPDGHCFRLGRGIGE